MQLVVMRHLPFVGYTKIIGLPYCVTRNTCYYEFTEAIGAEETGDTDMAIMTKEQAIGFGGKIWSKEGEELRVYLSKDAILNIAAGIQILSSEEKAAAKSKTFLDLHSGELKSDTGLVRSLLKNSGFECEKA